MMLHVKQIGFHGIVPETGHPRSMPRCEQTIDINAHPGSSMTYHLHPGGITLSAADYLVLRVDDYGMQGMKLSVDWNGSRVIMPRHMPLDNRWHCEGVTGWMRDPRGGPEVSCLMGRIKWRITYPVYDDWFQVVLDKLEKAEAMTTHREIGDAIGDARRELLFARIARHL